MLNTYSIYNNFNFNDLINYFNHRDIYNLETLEFAYLENFFYHMHIF